jgi:antitoxin (DNA-binding transcriptional repressor) of toxin-antitoxin stability system
MTKQISATSAKNNFGGLLEDVLALGRVDIVRHGRVVAIVMSPRELEAAPAAATPAADKSWRRNHAIPAELARRARIVKPLPDLDEDSD